jgi:hypothetical protein
MSNMPRPRAFIDEIFRASEFANVRRSATIAPSPLGRGVADTAAEGISAKLAGPILPAQSCSAEFAGASTKKDAAALVAASCFRRAASHSFPPLFFAGPTAVFHDTATREETIYYDLREIRLAESVPNIRAPRPGGKSGRETHRKRTSVRGSNAFHPHLTLTMNPPIPDNNHQTIIQPASPPDLMITHDVKLSNILIASAAKPLRPQLPLAMAAPHVKDKHYAPVPGVAEDLTASAGLLPAPLPIVNDAPRLAVSVGTIPQPRAIRSHANGSRASKPAPAVPDRLGNRTGLEFSSLPALNDPSSPAVPVGPMPQPRAPSPGWNGRGGINDGLPAMADSGGILALSVDPAALRSKIGVPAGNRYGAFIISPEGSQPGSPAGEIGGEPQCGQGPIGAGPAALPQAPEATEAE